DRELSGLEFAAGIPGSVGGALYGNAGCYGEDIGSYTIECTITSLDGSKVETKPASWFQFAYRDSRLKRDPRVLISCLLQLRKGNRAEIQKVIDEKLEIRRVKHPQWRVEPAAGSYFKNLPPDWQMPGAKHSPGTHRVPAGQLLDEVGCRGLRVGDAMVFPKHANIIVNAGRATAREVLELAEIMKARVRERFGVRLEEEVMFLGEKPSLGRRSSEPIRGAKKSLDFEEFYLSTWPGEPMDEILDAIGQAARRGVRVRLLLDARMHETYPRTADSLARVAGVAVRIIDMGRIAGGIQ